MRYKELTFEGRNAVLEAFRSGKTIDKLFILDGCQDGPIKSIVREAKKTSTIISYVDKERLDRLANTGHHQGVVAIGAAYEYAEVEDILEAARSKGEAPFIFVLDEIEDPHNLGAIVRSSEAFGVDAIIIPNDRSVQITSTVVKTSVGTIEKVKIVNVPNINNAIRKLKDLGYWIVGTDMEGTNYTEIDYKTKIGLVIGNEGKGISKVTTSNCDYIAKIPMKGTVNSLNASVACGIFLSEINRSRGI